MVMSSNNALRMRKGCITRRRRSVYVAAHRGIAAVRATSAGKWLGTVEKPLPDENLPHLWGPQRAPLLRLLRWRCVRCWRKSGNIVLLRRGGGCQEQGI